ncbi:MAG: C10 family peptidase [Bacteroidaceae bacterium]|nr:C10 family peptidase [Bacteroidaceae bacterium]
MRNFLHILTGIGAFSLMVANATAREIPASQAAQIAQGFSKQATAAHKVKSNVQPVLVHTETDNNGQNLFYVFNRPGHGYIIVAADDNARQVLAYSDNQEITDYSLVPENMKNFLHDYATQIVNMRSNSAAKAPKAIAREAIEPLTKSEWDQRYPYNILMPEIGGFDDDGEPIRAVTGCVATAMAQIMKYHQYPLAGTGRFGYTDVDGRFFTSDFEHPIDWEMMTNIYDHTSQQANKEEVARLMYDCAISLKMYFLPETSASYTYDMPMALIEYFGYDRGMLYESRSTYTDEEWEDKVYAELQARRPVVYAATSIEGGHTFIVDGADANGLFHVNWGWGGFENGYFALTGAEVLNPEGGGAGGSNEKVSYDQGQHAIFGIQPDKGNDYVVRFVSEEPISMEVKEVARPVSKADALAWIDVKGRFMNYSLKSQKAEYALRFENLATHKIEIIPQKVSSVEEVAGTGVGYYPTISIHQSEVEWMPDGEYDVKPMWRVGGEDGEWQFFYESALARTGEPLRLKLTNGHPFYMTRKVEVEQTAADGIIAKATFYANADYEGYIRPFIAEEVISESGKQWIVKQHADDNTFLFDSKAVHVSLKAGEEKEVVFGPFPYDTYRYDFNALLRLRVSQNEVVTRDDETPAAPVADDIETIFNMTIAENNPVKIYNTGYLAVASGSGDNLVFTVPVHANTDVKGKLSVHVFHRTGGTDEDPLYGADPNGKDQDIPLVDVDMKAGDDAIITISGKYISSTYDIDAFARVFFTEGDEINFLTQDQVLVPNTYVSQTLFKITAPVTGFVLNPLTDLLAVDTHSDQLTFSISLYSNIEKDIYLIIPYIYQWYEDEQTEPGYCDLYVNDEPLAKPYVQKVHLAKGVNTFILGPIFYDTSAFDMYNIAGNAELYFSLDGSWNLDDDYFYNNNYLGNGYFNIDVPTGVEPVVAETPENEVVRANTGIYAITGQRMPNNVRQLPRGLYIIGGKKVLVK